MIILQVTSISLFSSQFVIAEYVSSQIIHIAFSESRNETALVGIFCFNTPGSYSNPSFSNCRLMGLIRSNKIVFIGLESVQRDGQREFGH